MTEGAAGGSGGGGDTVEALAQAAVGIPDMVHADRRSGGPACGREALGERDHPAR